MEDRTRSSHPLEVIFLIPARGGSKSIPRKNLVTLNQTPILQLAIESATNALIEKSLVVVSSEDDEIISVAEKFGASTIRRSEHSASDSAPAKAVLEDFLGNRILSQKISDQTVIVYLQPTSPFRTSTHVKEALKLYRKKSCPVVSVTDVSQHPQKMVKLAKDGSLSNFLQCSDPTANRQILPKILIPNGAIYIFKVSDYENFNNIPIQGSFPYLMSPEDSIDIDSAFDLHVAQVMFKAKGL